jgi:RNA polymerase primary sigma factor
LKWCQNAHKRLEEGKCKITDVIIGYQGDAEDFAEKKKAFDNNIQLF